MATNLQIDEKLLNKALKIGGFKTKRVTVNEALLEFVQRREQMKILDLFGNVDYDSSFDYKKQRKV
jgi:Arc/MetJ family transcription regulator